MKRKGAIGILGGMGPLASAYMYKLLIDLSIKHYGATNNDDFPEIILYSIPAPDNIANGENKRAAYEMLKNRVKQLNTLNVSCLSIACNTAHLLLDDLQEISKAPIVSMIDHVVATVESDKVARVGVLSTPFTLRSRLYQNALERNNIVGVVPSVARYSALEKVVRNILRGAATEHDASELAEIINDLRDQGAEGIILGCTELPLLIPYKNGLPIYNSIEILSHALLENYYGQDTV